VEISYEYFADYIDNLKGRNFVARLDYHPGPFYRVRIAEEVTRRSEFQDETRKVFLMKFNFKPNVRMLQKHCLTAKNIQNDLCAV